MLLLALASFNMGVATFYAVDGVAVSSAIHVFAGAFTLALALDLLRKE